MGLVRGADQVVGVGEVVEQANAALGRWLPLVGVAPSLAQDGSRAEDLRRLVAWFERVLVDPGSTDAPPLLGLDALVDELTTATGPDAFECFGEARWAVRVAEDLVRLRRLERHRGAPTTLGVARRSLAASLAGALTNIEGSSDPEPGGGA